VFCERAVLLYTWSYVNNRKFTYQLVISRINGIQIYMHGMEKSSIILHAYIYADMKLKLTVSHFTIVFAINYMDMIEKYLV